MATLRVKLSAQERSALTLVSEALVDDAYSSEKSLHRLHRLGLVRDTGGFLVLTNVAEMFLSSGAVEPRAESTNGKEQEAACVPPKLSACR